MLFDRLPIPARRDPQLSAEAKILLAAIVPKGGPWPDWVEITDRQIQEETGQSSAAVQRHLVELEAAGWIMRVKCRGRRKIHLLFDLAGRMQSSDSRSAIIRSEECTPQLRVMHSSIPRDQDLRETETKIPKGSPSATRPEDGASPTTTPKTKTEATEAEPVDWAKLLAEAPDGPFAKLARKMLAREQSTSASGSLPRSPEADVEGQSPHLGATSPHGQGAGEDTSAPGSLPRSPEADVEGQSPHLGATSPHGQGAGEDTSAPGSPSSSPEADVEGQSPRHREFYQEDQAEATRNRTGFHNGQRTEEGGLRTE